MRTKVFAYKDYIGIESNVEAEGLFNKPAEPNQLGFVLDASFVDISAGALKLLKMIPKSGDSLGDIDIHGTTAGKVVISFLGGPLKILKPCDGSTGSRDYDPSLIKKTVPIKIPKEFKDVVDARTRNKDT